ncbi:hypothetical protein D3C80_1817290 [compost metagenome]
MRMCWSSLTMHLLFSILSQRGMKIQWYEQHLPLIWRVCNQLGYLLRKEQVEFNRECVVEVLSRSNEPPSELTVH